MKYNFSKIKKYIEVVVTTLNRNPKKPLFIGVSSGSRCYFDQEPTKNR
nr:MAG TPA: hypothetical protein [Caudoviricetes sp.]